MISASIYINGAKTTVYGSFRTPVTIFFPTMDWKHGTKQITSRIKKKCIVNYFKNKLGTRFYSIVNQTKYYVFISLHCLTNAEEHGPHVTQNRYLITPCYRGFEKNIWIRSLP